MALLAAVLLTDVHWGVMQSVSWARMIQQADRSADFVDVVAATLSGADPCAHCLALQSERESEQEETLDLLTKLQVLAPISAASTNLSRAECPLFALAGRTARPADGFPAGIDPPPRA